MFKKKLDNHNLVQRRAPAASAFSQQRRARVHMSEPKRQAKHGLVFRQ